MLDLVIIGDIKTVLEGRVEKEKLFDIDLGSIAYGLGAGTFEDEKGFQVGEGLIFENCAHTYIKDKAWSDKNTLKTPFLMGIERLPKNALCFDKHLSISQLYEELLESYPDGYALVATLHFKKLETAFLKLPPIFQENINANKEKYWHQEVKFETTAHLFGIILPYLNEKAFYQNPNETSNQPFFYSHTHALTNEGARHLLAQSLISGGHVKIESIQKL